MSRLIVIAMLLLSLVGAIGVHAQDTAPCTGDSCPVEVAAADDQPHYGLSADVIEAYTPPAFDQLTIDPNLLYDRRYARVSGALNVYDAPGGNLIRTQDAGFNFVTIMTQLDNGWTQINPGEWVETSKLADSNDVISWFTGIFLTDPLPQYPVAWMLINAYPSDVPGGEPDETRPLIYRYTRVNLFASRDVDGWTWYQIGPDTWVVQTAIAQILPVQRPDTVDTDRWVSVDLYEQVLIAYEGNTPVFATLVSTGLPRWPTREGTFHIYVRHVREDMTWGTPGDDYYLLEEVPWTMFFDEGRALHGEYWHDGLGYRHSHGCVNISITDAHWLYLWVAQTFDGKLNSAQVEDGPAVYVYSSGVYK